MPHPSLRSLIIAFALGAVSPACVSRAPLPDVLAPDASPDVPSAVDAPSGDTVPPWLAPYRPSPRAEVPTGFLWGSATAPFQVEGMLDATDWGAWAAGGGHIAHGDDPNAGPDSFDHAADDVSALTATGQNAYRFGIELARLFPTASDWAACRAAATTDAQSACHAAASAAGLAYYHSLLAQLRAAHVTPLVTLQHFSLPTYLDDASQDWRTRGWMHDAIVQDLAVWARFVAGEFGGEVDWYVTLNEPMIVITLGYLDGVEPPGQAFQFDAAIHAIGNMVHAHVAMFDAIHAADTTVASTAGPIAPAPAASVSIAQHVRRFFPFSTVDPRDAVAARRADYLLNQLFLDAIVHGDFDVDGNGTIDPGEPSNDPALRGHADYLGINYYGLTVVQASAVVPLLHGIPQPDATQRGLPKTDYGWDIYPAGFQDEIAWAHGYGLPLVVTENGIADASDRNRPRFLAEHLAAMGAAIAAGAHVVGYFHWATIDNFEWIAGYCPRFGLYSVDYTSPARTRTARPSAALYRSIIEAGGVSDAMLAAQPAYVTATSFCPLGSSDGGT